MPDPTPHVPDPPLLVHQVKVPAPMVALTFDDGPDPRYTVELLQVFAELQGKATFFMVGQQVQQHPEVALQVHLHGHEVGNHTFSHPFLTRLSATEQLRELQSTREVLHQLTGKPGQVFRPPYLDTSPDVAEMATSMGYHSIGAVNLHSRDWECPGVDHLVQSALETVQPGSILLFHDSGGDRSQTVEATRILGHALQSQGYQLVTVSQLLTHMV